MSDTFKEGQVVCLKSDHARLRLPNRSSTRPVIAPLYMTVTYIAGRTIICAWSEDGQIRERAFTEHALRIAEPERRTVLSGPFGSALDSILAVLDRTGGRKEFMEAMRRRDPELAEMLSSREIVPEDIVLLSDEHAAELVGTMRTRPRGTLDLALATFQSEREVIGRLESVGMEYPDDLDSYSTALINTATRRTVLVMRELRDAGRISFHRYVSDEAWIECARQSVRDNPLCNLIDAESLAGGADAAPSIDGASDDQVLDELSDRAVEITGSGTTAVNESSAIESWKKGEQRPD
jgi:hypothetical protein